MTITTWPLTERPREKLLAQGPRHLTDAELLAIFLGTGTRGKTAVDLARELIIQFGSLKKLLAVHPHDFYQIKGLGKAKYALLKAAIELSQRCEATALTVGKTLNNSDAAKRFFAHRLKAYPHEVFACLFLDNQHRMLAVEDLFHGTINEASVYPREVIKRGLAHNAAKIILAHNHPSGDPTPSTADQEITETLKHALALVDIRLVDHIIVGQTESLSMAEASLLL